MAESAVTNGAMLWTIKGGVTHRNFRVGHKFHPMKFVKYGHLVGHTGHIWQISRPTILKSPFWWCKIWKFLQLHPFRFSWIFDFKISLISDSSHVWTHIECILSILCRLYDSYWCWDKFFDHQKLVSASSGVMFATLLYEEHSRHQRINE